MLDSICWSCTAHRLCHVLMVELWRPQQWQISVAGNFTGGTQAHQRQNSVLNVMQVIAKRPNFSGKQLVQCCTQLYAQMSLVR